MPPKAKSKALVPYKQKKVKRYIPKRKPANRTTCTGKLFQKIMRAYYNGTLKTYGKPVTSKRRALAIAYQKDHEQCGSRSTIKNYQSNRQRYYQRKLQRQKKAIKNKVVKKRIKNA